MHNKHQHTDKLSHGKDAVCKGPEAHVASGSTQATRFPDRYRCVFVCKRAWGLDYGVV